MANEAQVRCSLQIKADNILYQSQPTAFAATVTGRKGPVPGAVSIPTTGKVISLAELVTPGLCRLQNLDTENYVTVGLYNHALNFFFPLLELLPGESYIIRLTRDLLEEFVGTGTGTSGDVNQLFAMANHAAVVLLVEAFEA